MDTTQLKRIADALEEILKLVKQDMGKYESSTTNGFTTNTTTGKYEKN